MNKQKSSFLSSKMPLWSACLGNLFEHYDTALFGFLSTFLAPFLFPKQDPVVALILTYAMIPLGMIARPFGSLFFGFLGDKYGRRYALFISLVGMSIVSGMIALSPTYSQIGLLAPIIFCIGRILQNFFASGEIVGGAIFLLENAPEKQHDLLSGLYNASTIGGILLASAGVSLISYNQVIDIGWRWLYLFGCLVALFGCLLRRGVPNQSLADCLCSTNSSSRLSMNPSIQLSKLGKILWQYRKSLLLIAICSGFSYSNYSIALVLTNGFIPLISSVTATEMIGLNTLLLFLDFCLLPLFGWLNFIIPRERMMLMASLMIVFSALPLFALLEGSSLMTIICVRVWFVILGVAFCAPFYAWAQKLVPSEHRYTIISFGYSLGSQLFGGPTAAISLWLYKQTQIVSSAAWYWLLLALASSIAIVYNFEVDHVTLKTQDQ